jgi:hypothetical protein
VGRQLRATDTTRLTKSTVAVDFVSNAEPEQVLRSQAMNDVPRNYT